MEPFVFWAYIKSGLVIVIFVVIMLIVAYIKTKQKKQPHLIDLKEKPIVNSPFAFGHLRKLKLYDPLFDEKIFLEYAKSVFLKTHHALSSKNIVSMRAFLTKEKYIDMDLKIEQQRSGAPFVILDNISLKNNIYDVRNNGKYDIIDVAMDILADCVDKKSQNLSSHKKMWREKWTFIRSVKSKTIINTGISANKCPSCGAPLSVNTSGECDYCHSNITKGDFDWVLSEIAQLN